MLEDINKALDALKLMAAKSELTADDKKDLKAIIKAYELKTEIKKSSCPNCWLDATLAAYRELATRLQPETGDGSKIRLKAGVDIYWGGERVNEATVTDEKLNRWLAAGLPADFWEKY